MCNGASLPLLVGTCHPLDFYNAGLYIGLSYAFGGMCTGTYVLANPSVNQGNGTFTVSGTMEYTFTDLYDYHGVWKDDIMAQDSSSTDGQAISSQSSISTNCSPVTPSPVQETRIQIPRAKTMVPPILTNVLVA